MGRRTNISKRYSLNTRWERTGLSKGEPCILVVYPDSDKICSRFRLSQRRNISGIISLVLDVGGPRWYYNNPPNNRTMTYILKVGWEVGVRGGELDGKRQRCTTRAGRAIFGCVNSVTEFFKKLIKYEEKNEFSQAIKKICSLCFNIPVDTRDTVVWVTWYVTVCQIPNNRYPYPWYPWPDHHGLFPYPWRTLVMTHCD